MDSMKTILLSLLITLSGTNCFAQTGTVINAPSQTVFDERQIGIIISTGPGRFKITYSNWQQGNINYHDSLNGIQSNSSFNFEIGVLIQYKLSKLISIRPTYHTVFESGKLEFIRKTYTETVKLSTYSHTFSFPVVFNYNRKNYQPYITAGPTLLFMMVQHKDYRDVLPLKHIDILGEVCAGVDFYSKSLKCIISPGVRYSVGFLNSIANANNIYTNTIDELKRQSFSFSINFRAEIIQVSKKLKK